MSSENGGNRSKDERYMYIFREDEDAEDSTSAVAAALDAWARTDPVRAGNCRAGAVTGTCCTSIPKEKRGYAGMRLQIERLEARAHVSVRYENLKTASAIPKEIEMGKELVTGEGQGSAELHSNSGYPVKQRGNTGYITGMDGGAGEDVVPEFGADPSLYPKMLALVPDKILKFWVANPGPRRSKMGTPRRKNP
ncbi:hypothetical protein DFH07DRAFT_775738 [Mycena maculata]|uniref:Uncharacterized protein n=1 Tax=Mycena maculata TaxID=230809 RepID=A0AAD7ISR0_9AGAR|nr:hypothetical protein DFH07DRAFT_775738 [Mycena maculata]